jgi:glycosyltransferase involved in cell wall biosynthesis
MHVVLYTHSRLPVHGYGGTQRVVVWLARGLVSLGHRVTLIAPTGSAVTEARMVGFETRDMARPGFDLDRLVPGDADIVHAHAPLPTPISPPTVCTQHGNRHQAKSADGNTIFLSADHARRHGGTAFVYNGIDPAEYVYRTGKANYDLFLGRLHSAKGYRWAIEGAKLAGTRLLVAGGWRPSLRPSLRFVGSVQGERKAALLANAQCLWMPALWDEPFGLTLIEAMMSGTPVLGTRRGALPEIVSPEVGALGDTIDDLVRLRAEVQRRDPAACRARAEQWFSHVRMAEEYLRMYQHYLATRRLPPGRMIP